MSGPIRSKTENYSFEKKEELNIAKKNFQISEDGQFGIRKFEAQGKSFKLVVPLPSSLNLKNDNAKLAYLNEHYGEEKFESLVRIATAAGLGKEENVASIAFKESSRGELESFKKVFADKSVVNYDKAYFDREINKLKLARDPEKRKEMQKLKELFEETNNVWKEFHKKQGEPSKVSDTSPRIEEERPKEQKWIRATKPKDLSKTEKQETIEKKVSAEDKQYKEYSKTIKERWEKPEKKVVLKEKQDEAPQQIKEEKAKEKEKTKEAIPGGQDKPPIAKKSVRFLDQKEPILRKELEEKEILLNQKLIKVFGRDPKGEIKKFRDDYFKNTANPTIQDLIEKLGDFKKAKRIYTSPNIFEAEFPGFNALIKEIKAIKDQLPEQVNDSKKTDLSEEEREPTLEELLMEEQKGSKVLGNVEKEKFSDSKKTETKRDLSGLTLEEEREILDSLEDLE